VLSHRLRSLVVVCLLVFGATAIAQAQTLERVKSRGRLVCGVNNALPGFGYIESDGSWSGFDVDFCRAIAAAVLGDPEAVEFVPLSAAQRQPAIQTGEVDVLIRNTTWTLSRDTEWTADFAPTTFYDGQGFMVRKDLGVAELEDLAGASICVTRGTTTELNLADTMRARGIPFTAVVFEEVDTVYNAYEQGRCDAVTSDTSQLASRRAVMANPDDHVILDVTISKEPLGPATRHGDNQWHDIVTWVVFATFFAEEYGITQANVGSFESGNPEVNRFLGKEGGLGAMLGLDDDWAVRVIQAVGNYAEIFERNLSPLGIPRGLNRQWTDGGLLFAYPFR
jgi:ABC-type amino acid transport/signal transduction systems, periplasmic component/domain